jgi:hypothetical protein
VTAHAPLQPAGDHRDDCQPTRSGP